MIAPLAVVSELARTLPPLVQAGWRVGLHGEGRALQTGFRMVVDKNNNLPNGWGCVDDCDWGAVLACKAENAPQVQAGLSAWMNVGANINFIMATQLKKQVKTALACHNKKTFMGAPTLVGGWVGHNYANKNPITFRMVLAKYNYPFQGGGAWVVASVVVVSELARTPPHLTQAGWRVGNATDDSKNVIPFRMVLAKYNCPLQGGCAWMIAPLAVVSELARTLPPLVQAGLGVGIATLDSKEKGGARMRPSSPHQQLLCHSWNNLPCLGSYFSL